MPRYSYSALDNKGQIIQSVGDFEHELQLFERVAANQLELISYQKIHFSFAKVFPSKIKRVELSEFLRNLALLIHGGVPLRDGLHDLVQTTEKTSLKDVFNRIRHSLEEGKLFSEALAQEQKYIPKIILPLVTIGEETGRLDQTLNDAANHLDKIQEIISSTKRAITYPIFVLAAMLGALVFWMVYVLPELMDLFKGMGLTQLPLPTRILMKSVSVFNTFWPVIPALLLILIFLRILTRKNIRLKYYWDLFWSKVPIAGTIIRSSQLAFFFEYTSLLTNGGINIVRTMEIMEESISNEVLRDGIHKIQKEITSGEVISKAIANLKFFEPFILRMVKVGEQTGNMPEQLHLLADYYMKKVNNLVSVLSKTIEPIIITIAGFIFMVIVLGLLGPVYMLASSMI